MGTNEEELDESILREVELEIEWFGRMMSAREKQKPRVDQLVGNSERLLEQGFWSASTVAAWTALEIYCIEVIVRSLFRALTWPFDELEQYLTQSIFGSNGKLDRLRTMLDKARMLGPLRVDKQGKIDELRILANETWIEVKWAQSLRNGIVHRGEDAREPDARRVLDIVKATIAGVERYLDAFGPYFQ